MKRDDWEHVSAEVVLYGSRPWVRGAVLDDSDELDMEECLWYLPKNWNSIVRLAITTSCSGFDDRTDICSYPISDLGVSEPGYDNIEAALDRLTDNDTLTRITIYPAEYGLRRGTLSHTLRLITQRGTPDIGFRLHNANLPSALRSIAQNIDMIHSSFDPSSSTSTSSLRRRPRSLGGCAADGFRNAIAFRTRSRPHSMWAARGRPHHSDCEERRHP